MTYHSDGNFDLVFTSGVLIHIPSRYLDAVMQEIYRCSQMYIFGFEYYADEPIKAKYRGYESLLWKADSISGYIDLFPDLPIIKEEKIKYLNNDNIDTMFLLEKR